MRDRTLIVVPARGGSRRIAHKNLVPIAGIVTCLVLMFSLPAENWLRLAIWLAIGLAIYFCYGRRHSTLGKELRGEISKYGVSPAGVPVQGE